MPELCEAHPRAIIPPPTEYPLHIDQRYDPTNIIYEEPETDDHGRPVKKPKPAADPGHTRPRRSVAAAARLRFQQKYSNMLVIDDLDSHRAHALCESSSSAGPNFLNPTDGLFCDMDTKTVYPVCPPQNQTTVCFDVEQNELGEIPITAFALN